MLRSPKNPLPKAAHLFALALAAAGIYSIPTQAAPKPPKRTIEFNRDVRSIVTKCFTCHGHDPKNVMANLHLDIRESAISTLKDGKRAIVPGHPEESELIRRIYATGDDQMPPKSSNKFLSEEEKQTLKKWIEEGAEYKPHWAFVTPIRYPLPKVQHKNWPRNGIDNFILAKLEENNLAPSPQADKYTLIRRVTLDLTGLPPTPEEITNFVNDKSPNAYEKVVDRLLASPRYGERMAMDWMDYARYADSNGYQADYERYQWRWRDWVINAFNQNMPYDQFTIKQLAGDLLPSATRDDIIATGFNRNHRINTEGGVIAEEWRVETLVDRVETTSETWLGLTAGCARCHDHKYDPISQKEFYQLCAYFNNVPESGSGVELPVNHPPLIQAPYPDQAAQLENYDKEIAKLQKTLDAHLPKEEVVDWQLPEPPPVPTNGLVGHWQLGEHPALILPTANGNSDSRPSPLASSLQEPKAVGQVSQAVGRRSGAILTGDAGYIDLGNIGDFEKDHPFSYGAWVFPVDDTYGVAMSRMNSAKDYQGWDFGVAQYRPIAHIISDWPRNAIKVNSKVKIPQAQWSHVFITYDGSGKAEGVTMYINGKQVDKENEQNTLTGSIRNDVHARIGRRVDSDFFSGRVDDPVLYDRVLTADEVKTIADVHPAYMLIKVPPNKRTVTQSQTLKHLWAYEKDPEYKSAYDELQGVQKKREDLAMKVPTVMVMKEMDQPRNAYILIRGQYNKHGAQVYADIPSVFKTKDSQSALPNRLGLAKWIVNPNNPLTARVAVNRMWERLFGTGIVATIEDFGTGAEFPSHPELLDWLATEFVRLKWDQKAMWKELVMSATYRQSSVITPELERKDPNNRLLARGPRYRLPGEVIRDQALFASGLLTEKLGGPSVRPYQPDGTWDELNVYGNLRNYKHDTGPNLHRRSLYTIWKRTAPPPNMILFDVPAREVCRVVRPRTDTPLQALDLMNDVTYLEAARALAQRMLHVVGEKPRLQFAFMSVLRRNPTDDELRILQSGVEKRLAYFEKEPEKAKKLISQGDLPVDSKFTPAQIAAYTMAASTILNLDETINKE